MKRGSTRIEASMENVTFKYGSSNLPERCEGELANGDEARWWPRIVSPRSGASSSEPRATASWSPPVVASYGRRAPIC